MQKFFYLIIILSIILCSCANKQAEILEFDKDKALKHLKRQVSFGPRLHGTEPHNNTVRYITDELDNSGWISEIQEFEANGHQGKNVIGKYGAGQPWVIIGAHYDTRMISDHELDPTKILTPVPGANDGASGVAVLLELARILPVVMEGNLHQNENNVESSIQQVWLVFFDLEDNGDIPGYDWILGSQAFVETLENKPEAAIIVDMIGDSNLKIYIESNSNYGLSEEIWTQADNLGYNEQFIPQIKYSIIDDHIPFLENGIEAVDIIDFEYPYWHTTQDTIDKVSPDSLKVVGDTLLNWILNKRFDEQ